MLARKPAGGTLAGTSSCHTWSLCPTSPKPTLVYALALQPVREMLNMKIYVDTDDDVRLARRCVRVSIAKNCCFSCLCT